LENPKEQIANSNFDLEKIRAKLRKFLEPKKDEDEGIAATTETSEEIIEIEELEKSEEVEETVVEAIETETPAENKSSLDKMSELGEKSVVTLAEIINPEEEEIDILETKDNTEISRKYTVEEEIQGLKEIISYLNDKNQFKKALIYQRRLVKLAREENIKAHEDIDLKQRTLSDF
jgi:hypothetical protein